MSSEVPVIDREEIERTLCQIAEIEAVRVVGDHDNLIQELHVLASGQKAPRQIVRDIESLLMTRFGIAVDHKKVSIAQINTAPETKVRGAGRLKINNVIIDTQDRDTAIEIKLNQGDIQLSGKAKGPSSVGSRLRLAALAALDAAVKSGSADAGFALEHVSIVPAGVDTAALVCVSIMRRSGEERYAGTAIVKGTEIDAVVKATMSAVNRNLTLN